MSQAIATFREEALKKVSDLLLKAGLRRQSATNFILTINEDVVGLVGLTVITEPGNDEALHMSVSLGVRHEDLEKIVSDLSGQKFDPCTTATLGTSLGYLTPNREYSEFPFTKETVGAVAEDLVQTTLQYGLTWMTTYDSLEKMLTALVGGKYTYKDAAKLRIPAAHYLKGDVEDAKALVHQQLAALGSLHGPVSDQYRRFANGLLTRLLR